MLCGFKLIAIAIVGRWATGIRYARQFHCLNLPLENLVKHSWHTQPLAVLASSTDASEVKVI